MSVTGTSILALAALVALLVVGKCGIHNHDHDHDHDHDTDHDHQDHHDHKHEVKRQADEFIDPNAADDLERTDIQVTEAADTGSPSEGPSAPKALSRRRRDLSQLCELIHGHTNESCMAFLNYGCYCGKVELNDAKPVDRIDRCCLNHQKCSVKANRQHCRSPYAGVIEEVFHAPQTYFVRYQLDCRASRRRGHLCKCTDQDKQSCAYQTCTCDLQLARCFKKRRQSGSTWNDKYRWSQGFTYKSKRCNWSDHKYCADVCLAKEKQNQTIIENMQNKKNRKMHKHDHSKIKASLKTDAAKLNKDIEGQAAGKSSSSAAAAPTTTTTTNTSSSTLTADRPLQRHRRAVMQLCEIVSIHNPYESHWSGWDCYAFMNYGCFCGSGGANTSTGRPVDPIDKCCKDHDVCYGLTQNNCTGLFGSNSMWPSGLSTFSSPYSYECRDDSDDGAAKWTHKCKCTDPDQASCAYKSCDCDLRFARCLRRQREMGANWTDEYAWKNGFDPNTDPICGPKPRGDVTQPECDCSKYVGLNLRKKYVNVSKVVGIDTNHSQKDKVIYSVVQTNKEQTDETTESPGLVAKAARWVWG